MVETEPESLALPAKLDLGLLVVAVSGVSFSAPLIAATAAPALAIAFWRTAIGCDRHRAGDAAPSPSRTARSEPAGGRDRGVGRRRPALHFATWVPSVTMTSVASATALVATQSVFVALIAQLRGRRLPRLAWLGIAISTVGVVLITGADVGLSGRALVGDVLAVLGGLFAAIYVTIGARARQQMPTSIYTSICYVVCAVVLLWVLPGRASSAGGFSTTRGSRSR